MNRITIDWANEIVEKAILFPRLGDIFGPVSEDTHWHWAAFELPDELGGGWVPCAWSEMEQVLSELEPELCENFSAEKIKEVFRQMNPSFSEPQIERLQAVSQEIFARSAYHRFIPENLPENLKRESAPRMGRTFGLER